MAPSMSWTPARTPPWLALALAALALAGGLAGVAELSTAGPPIPAEGAFSAPVRADPTPELAPTAVHALAGTTNTVIDTIPLYNAYPSGFDAVYDPTNGYVYFAANETNLSIVNTANNKVVENLTMGQYADPADPWVAANGDVYLPEESSTYVNEDNLSVISPSSNTYLENISTGFDTVPQTPVYDPINGDLYVPDLGTNGSLYESNITVVNVTRNVAIANITVGLEPTTPAFDPADNDLYVPCTDSLGGDQSMYIISAATNTVVGIYDNLSLLGLNLIGQESPVYSPVSQEVYISNANNVTVSVFKGSSFVENISVGGGGPTPVIDPATGNIFFPLDYTANGADDGLAVIDPHTNTLVTNLTIGNGSGQPTYDPANGEVYIPEGGDADLWAINGSSYAVEAIIPVGGGPLTPAFDPVNDDLYVPNAGINSDGTYNMSVVGGGPLSSKPGTYTVTFSESGLTSGYGWNVTFNGSLQPSTGSIIDFYNIADGPYAYTIGPWQNESACTLGLSSTKGTLTVSGKSVTVDVPFTCSSTTSHSPPASPSSGSGTFLGLPGDDGYFLIGGLVVVVVVVVAAVAMMRKPRIPTPAGPGMSGAPPGAASPPPAPWAPPPPPPPPPP